MMQTPARVDVDTDYLTGLRGVAALLVFVAHSGGLGLRDLGWAGDSFVNNTRFGVAMFFVISAYCLCLVTAQYWDGRSVDWRAFYVRRAFRILPLYFVMLFVYAGASVLRGTAPPDLVWSLISHLTFFNIVDAQHAHDIFIEWTVVVEVTFYLLFPLFLWLARSIRWGMVLVAVLLSWRSLRLVVISQIGGAYADNGYFTLPFHIFAFAFGIAAYTVTRRAHPNRIVSEAICLASLAYFVWAMIQPNDTTNEVPITYGVFGLVVGAANPSTVLARVLRTPALLFVGQISFSIYLVHMLVLSFTPPGQLNAWLALIVTLAVSALTWRTIEEPMRQIGRRLASRGPRWPHNPGAPQQPPASGQPDTLVR